MADFNWGDMPEELAAHLYAATYATNSAVVEHELGEAVDWVCNNIQSCAATKTEWTSLPEARCAELPVPGSEFCPLHMPAGELGDNGN